ncbi:hypothetical protein [Aeromonas salmonicida]|uniref:hypothetical protein n=1 Tax=Aeromonas salmonicida TaxID=645 RepID=UPI0038BD4487
MNYFIPILMVIFNIMALLCWWSDNSLRQRERDEAIARLKVQGMTADMLSEAELALLRKVYKRRFTDGAIYQHEGVYNIRQLAPGWRQRWQDTCVGDVRVESIYWPSALSCKEASNTIGIRGIIYKDALYAISVDDALLIPEVRKSEHLSRQWVPREFDVVYLEALHFIMPIFSIFTFIFSLSSSVPILLILLTLIIGILSCYLWLVQKLHRLFVLDGKCSLLPANSAFGERKVINGCMVSDPAKKLLPGEHYRLHCLRSPHELFFSPERLDNKEYVDGTKSLLFGSRQLNCALALGFFVAHFISLHSLYHSSAYQVHAGFAEYEREKVIDGDHFAKLYDLSPKDFIHVSGILAITNEADDIVCLRDKHSVNVGDFKDAFQHIIDMDYSTGLDSGGVLSELYPEAYEYIVNIKNSKQSSCPVAMSMTGANKNKFNTSPTNVLEYLSKNLVDNPEAMGRRIYENFYGHTMLGQFPSKEKQEVKKTISPAISYDFMVNSISTYVYGGEIPDKNSISGLVVSTKKNPDGNVVIFLDDGFTPTPAEEIESVYYKILINIVLALTYFVTFLGFLIGWFKESGSSPSMPASTST